MKYLKILIKSLFILHSTFLFAWNERQGPTENIGGFLDGTIIQTSGGVDYIQNIKKNDIVLSFSFETNEVVEGKVIDAYRFKIDQLVRISIDGEEFYLNPEHRFYSLEYQQWVKARDLKIGSHGLMKKGGRFGTVDDLEIIDGTAWLYDFTVEETENYFVGNQEILVHNFVFVIPILTWVIGEALIWARVATIAVAIGTAVVINEVSKKSDNKQDDTIEFGAREGQPSSSTRAEGRYEAGCNRANGCEPNDRENTRNTESKGNIEKVTDRQLKDSWN